MQLSEQGTGMGIYILQKNKKKKKIIPALAYSTYCNAARFEGNKAEDF